MKTFIAHSAGDNLTHGTLVMPASHCGGGPAVVHAGSLSWLTERLTRAFPAVMSQGTLSAV